MCFQKTALYARSTSPNIWAFQSRASAALTESGLDVAKKIYERHTLLSKFLVRLGVDEKTAAEDACKMEHDISDESFSAIKEHIRRSMKNADE